MGKKLLSMLLVLCMVLPLLPVVAGAVGSETPNQETDKISVTINGKLHIIIITPMVGRQRRRQAAQPQSLSLPTGRLRLMEQAPALARVQALSQVHSLFLQVQKSLLTSTAKT